MRNKVLIIRIIISLLLWIMAIIFQFTLSKYEILYAIIYVLAYLIAGYDILFGAIRNIFRGKIFDENFLMAIASIGAFCLRFFGHIEYLEAVAVMIFFQIGEVFQGIAVEKSRNAIINTMNLSITKCHLEDGSDIDPDDVCVGQRLIVRVGEMVPVDSIALEDGIINTSSLTGEALDVEISKGDSILSGSINTNKPLLIEASKEYYDSTAAKILDMVENATMKKAKSEQFITKFARFYTPIVVLLAVLLAVLPPLFLGFTEHFAKWLYRALSCLVVSCPCALVVSVPLSYFAGIGAAAKNKIIVKGGSYLEDLALCDTIIMDKTGTITKSEFQIKKIISNDDNELLKIAKGLEINSNHPIAEAIKKMDIEHYSFEISEAPGYGIIGKLDNDEYICGSKKLLDKHNIKAIELEESGSVLYIAKNNECLGAIILEDVIKSEAKNSIALLKSMNKRIVVLSGDTKTSVEGVCNELNIKEYNYSLLPQDKVNLAKEIIDNNSNKTIFVGDGINDAPVLAISDVGVSMGQIGSDAAVEASDVVILNDNLEALPKMLKIAKKTKWIVLQNIIFTIFIKILALVLCGTSVLPMTWAIFADVGVCVIAVINAMRALRIK